ncbi:hypothetical protein HB779_22970 (plasmid) [Phyllobacterium sp. 628]|uniref:DUF3617 domain-containing protein n=1 Tax=Phyllobacterium sp. 628 TaxID=2718938 RepID=UPI00166280E7|nr:DUF3617 family protein [Phyllobacterium sp. 628]QND54772.1 hypothetical protein HB779_22970 [Phyllobacterium sp. 628]
MKVRRQIIWAAAILAAQSAAALADDIPQRKAGLWETTIEVNGKSVTTRQCVSDATDALIISAQAPADASCSKRLVTKTSDGYLSEYNCKIGSVVLEGRTVVTGDLNSEFKLESNSVRSGMPNRPDGISRTILAVARWLSPCEPGK